MFCIFSPVIALKWTAMFSTVQSRSVSGDDPDKVGTRRVSAANQPTTEVPLSARYGESTGVIERGMDEERRTGTLRPGSVHRLGGPAYPTGEFSGGRTCQRTGRMSNGSQGVGSTHSTLRTGLVSHGWLESITIENRDPQGAEPDARHDCRPLGDRDLHKL